MSDQFIKKGLYNHNSYTQNMAVSHSTSGSKVLDYFSKMGTYRNRSVAEVYADIAACWAENPLQTIQVIVYNRLITRKTHTADDVLEKVQRGQGNRDESRKAFGWLLKYEPEVAYKNLEYFMLAGTWKDLWHRDLIDLIDWRKVCDLIYTYFDVGQPDLVVKYLPRIRSRSNIKNEYHKKLNSFARYFCDYLGWTEQDYRQCKSDPSYTAHLWQRQMSSNDWNSIDFNRIPGKALFNAVSQKGKDGVNWLQRHGLEDKYEDWLDKQPIAKFTGYPYELFVAAFEHGTKQPSRIQAKTYDKQFEGLVALGKSDNGAIRGNVWCALDTSGSMTNIIDGKKTTAYDVCIGLGIYFSALNEGAFANHVIMFNDHSYALELRGTFTQKAQQVIGESTAWGSTNFQSVIEEIVRIRRTNPNIPVEDYPQTLLVVSDMQFNPAGKNVQTNYEYAMQSLAAVGLPPINIIWWQVNGQYGNDVPNKMDDKGVTMLSGFDGATIGLILGGNKSDKPLNELTPYEQMCIVLDQELLNFCTL